MSNVCSQPGNSHQTNDVIARSGKCHVTSLVVAKMKESARTCAILWRAHELQTDTSWREGGKVQRQLAWTTFVNMQAACDVAVVLS
jgi:hypothetical protein